MTIEDQLKDAVRQLKRYGNVEPSTIIFGDGFVDALANEKAIEPEPCAVLLMAAYPDGYVGRKYEHLREAAALFRIEQTTVLAPRSEPWMSASVTLTFEVDEKARRFLQEACTSNAYEVVEPITKPTWRDLFRDDKGYGKKARRRHR